MKLITEYRTVEEARDTQRRFRQAGVAVWLSGADANVSSRKIPVGVWACLDEQAEDAARLLFDPDHAPAQPLSTAQIDELLAALEVAGRRPHPAVMRWALGGLALLSGLFALVWWLESQ